MCLLGCVWHRPRLPPTKQNETLTLCCFKVRPSSATLAQLWNNIESMYRVWYISSEQTAYSLLTFACYRFASNMFILSTSYRWLNGHHPLLSSKHKHNECPLCKCMQLTVTTYLKSKQLLLVSFEQHYYFIATLAKLDGLCYLASL